MSFGDIIKSASTPSTYPFDIGGDSSTIWHCDPDADRIYELSISDLSVVRSGNSPGTFPEGIGGDSSTIWHTDGWAVPETVYELDVSDFSVIRHAATPGKNPYGIGGKHDVIWHVDPVVDRVYELSIIDFSVVRSATSPTTRPYGVGGDLNTIWYCDCGPYNVKGTIHELDVSDFSVLRSVNQPEGTGAFGIGGNYNTIWFCNYWDPSKAYELDAANVVTLSGTISDEWGNLIRDADITISNGATYTTTTDENGAYSQLVNPDTYDIAASKSRSRFHDITESVSVTADTTKNITMPTDRIVGKAGKQKSKGMSIPGGIEL